MNRAAGRFFIAHPYCILPRTWLLTVYDCPWDKPEDAKKISLLGRYTGGDANQGYHVGVMAYHNQWHSSDQIPQRAVDERLTDSLGQIDPFLGGRTSRYTQDGEFRSPVGPGHVLINAYAAHYDFDLFSNFT